MIYIKDDAKIMADLLRSGHTMLNLACPVCNNPLFRDKNNDIFCSICKKKVIIKKNEEIDKSSKPFEKKNEISETLEYIDDKGYYNFNSLKTILAEKIKWVSQKLEKETQLDLIERYIEVLIKLFDFLKKFLNGNASAGI